LRGSVATCLVLGRSLPDLLAAAATASLAGDFSCSLRGSPRSSDASWGTDEQAHRFRLPPALGRLLQGACRGRDDHPVTEATFRDFLPPASSVAPPPFSTRCVHTRLPPKRRSSPARHHPPLVVPPSWSLTTSTACSAPCFRECCIPCRPWGSPRFCATSPSEENTPHVPETLTPLDEVPSPVAVTASLRHRALLTFLPLSPARDRMLPLPATHALEPSREARDSRALLHRRVRSVTSRFQLNDTLFVLGFHFPSKVSPFPPLPDRRGGLDIPAGVRALTVCPESRFAAPRSH
jgi:hypothetical protein